MKKALIIDDSRAMRLILGRILEQFGYQICAASNGRDALNLLGRESPKIDVMLVDWNMPEMNGLEFVKAIRKHPGYLSVPLMMVTTETEADQMIAALDAGANEYVMKPFTDDVIADKLRLIGVLPAHESGRCHV